MKKLAAMLMVIGLAVPAMASTYVGVGGTGPLNVLTPNTVAWRFGTGGMMVEPSLTLSYGITSNRTPADSSDVTNMTLGFNFLGLFSFINTQCYDVHGLAGLGVGMSSNKTTSKFNANNGDYNSSSSLGFGVPFGLGMQVKLAKAISAGVDAISGFSFTKSSSKSKAGNTTTDNGGSSNLNFSIDNTVFRFMLFFGK